MACHLASDRAGFAAVSAEAVRILIPAARFGGGEPRIAELVVGR